MPELPAITGAEAVRAFGRAGFVLDRIRGSHHILKRPGHRFVLSIPVHGAKTLGRGLLKGEIAKAGMSLADFQAFLDS